MAAGQARVEAHVAATLRALDEKVTEQFATTGERVFQLEVFQPTLQTRVTDLGLQVRALGDAQALINLEASGLQTQARQALDNLSRRFADSSAHVATVEASLASYVSGHGALADALASLEEEAAVTRAALADLKMAVQERERGVVEGRCALAGTLNLLRVERLKPGTSLRAHVSHLAAVQAFAFAFSSVYRDLSPPARVDAAAAGLERKLLCNSSAPSALATAISLPDPGSLVAGTGDDSNAAKTEFDTCLELFSVHVSRLDRVCQVVVVVVGQ
jgi:hypothetical protein